jgi:hypothetical protein
MGGPPTTVTCDAILAQAAEVGAVFSKSSSDTNTQVKQITS